MRVVGGFIRSSPIHVMECELCIPPLHLRRRFLGYKYCLKTRSWSKNGNNDVIEKLQNLCLNRYWMNKKKPLLPILYEEIKSEHIHSSYPLEMFSFNTWLSNIETENVILAKLESVKKAKDQYNLHILKNQTLLDLNTKYTGWHKLYTDGSRSDKGMGAAFWDPVLNKKVLCKMNKSVSIMTAELLAILEAVLYADTLEYNKIVVLSDSKSALQHIMRCASGYRGVPLAYAVLRVINKLHNTTDKRICLQWIPAHIGLRGNEEADKLAKLAVEEGVEIYVLPSYTEVVPKFKIYCYNLWKEYFDKRSLDKGIWYRIIQSQPPRVPWFSLCKISRAEIITAHRLRSGHAPLNKFGYLMKKVESPNCEVCGKIEDVQHLLTECVRNASERRVLLSSLGLDCSDVNVGVFFSIIAEPTSINAQLVYKFVKKCLELRRN